VGSDLPAYERVFLLVAVLQPCSAPLFPSDKDQGLVGFCYVCNFVEQIVSKRCDIAC
jgi:hypothetical protein